MRHLFRQPAADSLPAGSTLDPQGIEVEVYNPHSRPVVFLSQHPHRWKRDLREFRMVCPPKSFILLPHTRFLSVFEDGEQALNLTVNMGPAKGQGITHPSQWRNPDPKTKG